MSAAPRTSDYIPFMLEVIKGPHRGQVFNFNTKSVFIGRGDENEVMLAQDPRISRQHAEVKQINGQFFIVNLSQKNFVLLDGSPIETERISQDSILQIGESELKFTAQVLNEYINPHQPPAPPLKPNPHQSISKLQPVPPAVPPAVPPGTKSLTLNSNEVTQPLIQQARNHTTSLGVQNKIQTGQQSDVPTKNINHIKGDPQNASSPQPLPHMHSGIIPGTKQKSSSQKSSTSSNATSAASKSNLPKPKDYKRLQFYGALILIGIVLYNFLFTGKVNQKNLTLRTSPKVQEELQIAEKSIIKLEEKISRLNETTQKRAQENYIKGFREFRQGNFLRAKEFFQIVLSLDPENELAKRYYNLSKVKLDELLQFHIMQGLRYREKGNFKLCRSSFAQALVLLQNNRTHASFQQADRFFQECDRALQGRY